MYAPSKLSQRNLEKYILVGYDKSNPAKQIIATHITVNMHNALLFVLTMFCVTVEFLIK